MHLRFLSRNTTTTSERKQTIKKTYRAKPCIAAIVAHADDLELVCGGTFAKYIAQGYKGIYGVLSLCNSGWNWNERLRQSVYSDSRQVIPRRQADAEAAAKVFGAELFKMDLKENIYTDAFGTIVPLSFPEGDCRDKTPPAGGLPLAVAAGAGLYKVQPRDDAIAKVAAVLVKNRPDIVIVQTVDDNPDHFAAALTVHKAYRRAAQSVALGPLYLPCWGNCFFPNTPDWLVDVTGLEKTVERALRCHRSQHGAGFIEGKRKLWRQWGQKIHVASAEAFIRLR